MIEDDPGHAEIIIDILEDGNESSDIITVRDDK